MADSPDFVPTVRVRDLIAAYEHFSETPEEIQQHRPRARSLGNILSRDVVVISNEFRTLEDIETALLKVERDLNFYNVYSKEKHVSLQERLFNLLTSVVNIESSDDDCPLRRKRLITKTQSLVSFLNQKLPPNSIPVEDKKFTYTTYSSFVTSKNQNVDLRGTDNVDYANDNVNQAKSSDHENRNSVSVQKLKHNYQPHVPKNSAPPIKPRSNILYSESKSALDQPSESKKNLKEENRLEIEPSEKIGSNENMLPSVFRLKGLFEEKAREANKGLEIIIRNPQYPDLASHIPYIDSTLTNHRQHRLMSGSYTDYAHMLMNVDIKRSRSAYELNNNVEVKKSDNSTEDDQQDSDDDTSSEESVQSVREVNLERANSVEEIPENIVQRTKLAYENAVYDSIQKDHTVYQADIGRQNPDNKNGMDEKISLTSMSHLTQADSNDDDVFGDVPSSYVIEDPEEIPVNIVQRTKQAYENAAIESYQEDHRINSNMLERTNSKPEIQVEDKIFVQSTFVNEDSSLVTQVNNYNALEEEQTSSYVIEDPEQIPENIVQRTKEAYENAVLYNDHDNTLQSTSVDRPNSDSRKLLEKFYPTSAVSNLNNDDILQEEVNISYVIEEPDEIPQNIVQSARKVYENAVGQCQADINNDNRRLHHATSFQEGSRVSCPTGQEENILFLTSEVTDEDAPQAIQLENEDMQEEEIHYLSAVTETEEIPANIVERTVKLYEDTVVDNKRECPLYVEREILYCTAETGESQPRKVALNMANIKENILYAPPEISEDGVPQAVYLDNEDMKEIDIKYSVTDSDEIPTNIVQRTVEAYENSVLEQEAVTAENGELRNIDREESTTRDQFDGTGEHGKVETFIEEEVKYSSALLESGEHSIILGQTMAVSEVQETNVEVQGFIEEDVSYSSSVVNLDGIASSVQNSKDNGGKPKLLLGSGVTNKEAVTREHPGYTNGKANDLSLDEEEDLKRAEEEFEKLLEQS